MKTTFSVRVQQHGTIRLPKELQKRHAIQAGDIVTLASHDNGVIVIRKRTSQVDELADRLANQWRETGESLESMLNTLQQVRSSHDKASR